MVAYFTQISFLLCNLTSIKQGKAACTNLHFKVQMVQFCLNVRMLGMMSNYTKEQSEFSKMAAYLMTQHSAAR